MRSIPRIGVFADVANMYRNGGSRMQYDVLRAFACRDSAEPVRLNAYVTWDEQRAARDEVYRDGTQAFHAKLRDYCYRVTIIPVRWRADGSGKADADVQLAVDAMTQSSHLDRVLIASGDGDFVPLVSALQAGGLRVEVVGMDNTALALRQQADLYMPGYLVPGLIPGSRPDKTAADWGEVGSRVRGYCYWHDPDRGFGYFRFLRTIGSNLWMTDAREPDSPWETAYFHNSHLPSDVRSAALPSRGLIFDFELSASDRADGFVASDIELVCRLD